MQFLVHTRRDETADPQVMKDGMAGEIGRVREMYGTGSIRQIWHRDGGPGAVMIMEAVDRDALQAELATLPLVNAGAVIVDEIIELCPYAGFVG